MGNLSTGFDFPKEVYSMAKKMRIAYDSYTARKDCSGGFLFLWEIFILLNNNKDNKQIKTVRQFKKENIQPFNSSVVCIDGRVWLEPFQTPQLSIELLGE